MMTMIKKLLNKHANFFSHKEQKAFELALEVRKEKSLNYHFFAF